MTHQITVLPANRQFTAQPGQTVLDAALAAGILLPYSCKNGACASCKGKVVEGTIEQGPHQAQSLTPDEAAQGMALFCCARAQTDLVIEARVIAGADGIVAKKMPCRVAAIESVAPDVAIVRLQLPAAEKLRYNAGQYLEILLKDGVRRSHSSTRAERAFAEQQKKTLKVYPILDWADAQVSVFMNQHDLPRHPLEAEGYVTMGDWHSTVPAVNGLSAEETRFNGEKYECGLHLDSGNSDFQI